VTNELSHFDFIVPCGLAGVTMTSVARERPGLSGPWTATREAVVGAFGAVFERELLEQPDRAALLAMTARS